MGICFDGCHSIFRIYSQVIALEDTAVKLETQNLGTTTKFIFVGYAVNNILPARMGEIFRAYYTARR